MVVLLLRKCTVWFFEKTLQCARASWPMCGSTGRCCSEARASVPDNHAALICRGLYITFKDEMGRGSGVMKVPPFYCLSACAFVSALCFCPLLLFLFIVHQTMSVCMGPSSKQLEVLHFWDSSRDSYMASSSLHNRERHAVSNLESPR